MGLRALVACEESGAVRRALRARGYEAWSCDLQPAADDSPFHLQCDVREVLADPWGLLIAHPVCRFLTNSGVRWLTNPDGSRNEPRWADMQAGVEFFRLFDRADHIPYRAVENPIMHGHALALVGRRADQFIQPWQFGHGEIKATGWWLHNLPKLRPTNIVEGREARVHRMPPGPDREKLRSRTLEGVAKAVAEQWGDYAAARMTERAA